MNMSYLYCMLKINPVALESRNERKILQIQEKQKRMLFTLVCRLLGPTGHFQGF